MNHSSPVRNQSRYMEHDQSSASTINARLALSPKNGIPMPDYHIKRTESELQLREDMAMAEYRDRCMFNRLVTGIQQRKQHYNSQQHQYYYGHGEGFAGGTATTETATETVGRNMHTSTRRPRTSARTSLPRSLLVPPPQNLPKQYQDQETSRTIGSIPYTRSCPSSSCMKDQAEATSSMITPIASDGDEYYKPRRSQGFAPTCAGDWSIEGFDDEPPSPLYSTRVNVIPHGWAPDYLAQSVNSRNSYDQTDQLFDMDL